MNNWNLNLNMIKFWTNWAIQIIKKIINDSKSFHLYILKSRNYFKDNQPCVALFKRNFCTRPHIPTVKSPCRATL